MEYETMKVDFGDLLPKELKVPRDAEKYAQFVLKKLYEPNHNRVPEREINPRSMHTQMRLPEYCYGNKAFDFSYEGIAFSGSVPDLDHTLNLMAQYEISRIQGRELVKLLVAKRFAEGNPTDEKTPESQQVLTELEKAVKIAWSATMQ